MIMGGNFDPAEPMRWPGETTKEGGHSLTVIPGGNDDPRCELNLQPGDAELAWYLIRAATRQEPKAEASLIEAGYVVYLPRAIRWRRAGPKKIRISYSLFGGYLFVGLTASQSFYEVEKLEGVHAAVRFGADRDPLLVPFTGRARSISAILAEEIAGDYDKTRRSQNRDPEAGTPIRMVSGMFQGWSAKFLERREDERIILMLNMFGKDVAYVADEEEVEFPANLKRSAA